MFPRKGDLDSNQSRIGQEERSLGPGPGPGLGIERQCLDLVAGLHVYSLPDPHSVIIPPDLSHARAVNRVI